MKKLFIIIILFFNTASLSYGLVVDSTITNQPHYLAYTNKIKISKHGSTAGAYGWRTNEFSPFWGYYDDTCAITYTVGNFISVNFLGTGLKFIATIWSGYQSALYYVDDTISDISNAIAVPDGSIDMSGGVWTTMIVNNIVSNLPFGWHTVAIQITNTAGIEADGFILDHAVGPVKNADISSKKVPPSDANLAVVAFQCLDIHDDDISSISITNQGTMLDTADISGVKLYVDLNGNFDYDGGDSFVANAVFASGKWNFTGLNVASGANLIITIDIEATTANYGRTFQGTILSGYVTCESNVSNNNNITNNGIYTIENPQLYYNLVVDSTITNQPHYLAYTNKIKISKHGSTAGAYGWRTNEFSPFWGYYDDTCAITYTVGNFISVNFLGTGLKFIATIWSGYQSALYYVDDTISDISNAIAVPDGSIDMSGGVWTTMIVNNIVSNLPFGWHTVAIQITNTAGIEADGFILNHAVGPVKNADISSRGVLASDINVPVMAFKCIDTMDHLIDNISIANLGTMQDTADISAVKLYEDDNGNNDYDAGDTWIADASYAAGKWDFTSLNLNSGKNLIITIDIDGATVNYGRTFRGTISAGDVSCIDGLTNNNIITNSGTVTLGDAPAVGPIIPSSAQVTNNNSQKLSFTTTLTEIYAGVGNVNIDLSSIGGPAAHPLTNSAGITYECSEITVPSSVFPTNYTLILKAYDNGNTTYSSNTMSITILPVIPPNIGDIIPSSAQVTNNNSQELSFATTITDKGSGRGNVYMNLSSIGGSTNYPLTNTAGNNYQGNIITVPSTVMPGIYTFTLKAYESGNNVYSSNTTTITVISVEPPTIGIIFAISTTPTIPTSISNNDNQKLSFTTDITDKGGGIGTVSIDLSQIGRSPAQALSCIATNSNSYTYKVSNITVPSSVPLSPPDYTLTLRAYNSGGGDSNTNTVSITVRGIANIAPIADAGPNQTNHAGSEVTLYGTNSSDPDNNTLTYTWSLESGWDTPIIITPDNITPSKATFTAPDVEEETELVIKLIVNDGTVDSAPDYVTNTIKPFEKNLKKAYIYPNPIIGCEPFTLAGLTKGKITIQIYDLLGHLVWENKFEEADNLGKITYEDGLCDIGKKLASGIYIVFIKDENGSDPKKLKLIHKKID